MDMIYNNQNASTLFKVLNGKPIVDIRKIAKKLKICDIEKKNRMRLQHEIVQIIVLNRRNADILYLDNVDYSLNMMNEVFSYKVSPHFRMFDAMKIDDICSDEDYFNIRKKGKLYNLSNKYERRRRFLEMRKKMEEETKGKSLSKIISFKRPLEDVIEEEMCFSEEIIDTHEDNGESFDLKGAYERSIKTARNKHTSNNTEYYVVNQRKGFFWRHIIKLPKEILDRKKSIENDTYVSEENKPKWLLQNKELNDKQANDNQESKTQNKDSVDFDYKSFIKETFNKSSFDFSFDNKILSASNDNYDKEKKEKEKAIVNELDNVESINVLTSTQIDVSSSTQIENFLNQKSVSSTITDTSHQTNTNKKEKTATSNYANYVACEINKEEKTAISNHADYVACEIKKEEKSASSNHTDYVACEINEKDRIIQSSDISINKNAELGVGNQEVVIPTDKKRTPLVRISPKTLVGVFEKTERDYGFIRLNNFQSGPNDIYLPALQIKRYGIQSGDIITCDTKIFEGNMYPSAVFVHSINGVPVRQKVKRIKFERITPLYPSDRISLTDQFSSKYDNITIRTIDLITPLGKGQRVLVSAEKGAGRKTAMREMAKAISSNYPKFKIFYLMVDERPEEVAELRKELPKADVVYTSFNMLHEQQIATVELVLRSAIRHLEFGRDAILFVDSLTKLSRIYNLLSIANRSNNASYSEQLANTIPRQFFGSARTVIGGGSLTIIASAIIDSQNSNDVFFHESLKGASNMELNLSNQLANLDLFPAVDLFNSKTIKEELLRTPEELNFIKNFRKSIVNKDKETALKSLLYMIKNTQYNDELYNNSK